MHDYQRPPTLYRYAPRSELELSLKNGQFRLVPANNCLTLSFSQAWDKSLFDLLGPADSCLIIHNTEEFGERLVGVLAGYLIYTGVLLEGPHAIVAMEKMTGRELGSVGREIVATVVDEQLRGYQPS